MTPIELKVDSKYNETEKVEFDTKMATAETKKELFNQKDWIRAEWKANLYKEISGSLKSSITELGKAILEKVEGKSYKLFNAYCIRSGITINQVKNILDKGNPDQFLLCAILQAGAIQCCDKENILRNLQSYLPGVDAQKSFAVDADPRGNTMAALMAIYDDKLATNTIAATDFHGGIPSTAFINAITNDIRNATNVGTTLNTDDQEEINRSKPPVQKQPEVMEREETFIDMNNLTVRELLNKLTDWISSPSSPVKRYKIDLHEDNKVGGKVTTFQFEKSPQTLTYFPGDIKGNWYPDALNNDIVLEYNGQRKSLRMLRNSLFLKQYPSVDKATLDKATPEQRKNEYHVTEKDSQGKYYPLAGYERVLPLDNNNFATKKEVIRKTVDKQTIEYASPEERNVLFHVTEKQSDGQYYPLPGYERVSSDEHNFATKAKQEVYNPSAPRATNTSTQTRMANNNINNVSPQL